VSDRLHPHGPRAAGTLRHPSGAGRTGTAGRCRLPQSGIQACLPPKAVPARHAGYAARAPSLAPWGRAEKAGKALFSAALRRDGDGELEGAEQGIALRAGEQQAAAAEHEFGGRIPPQRPQEVAGLA